MMSAKYRAGSRGPKAAAEDSDVDDLVMPAQEWSGADEGIRTRDPNLDNVEKGVRLLVASPAACDSAQPAVRRVGLFSSLK